MNNALEIAELCVEVDGRELLHDINLTVPHGEVHALLGPNGSGKTSLLLTIVGYPKYRVTRGHISFDGKELTNMGLTERARLGIGIAHQRPPTIAGVKLRQVLDRVTTGVPGRAGEANAWAVAARMGRFLGRDVNAGLSGGEIKRSELLQLLASFPRFAMLDEPDSGVDLESLELVGQMANTLFSKDPARPVKRRAGLIITHTGQILKYVHADKAHVMLDGRVACSGNPSLILETACESGYEECIRCTQEAG